MILTEKELEQARELASLSPADYQAVLDDCASRGAHDEFDLAVVLRCAVDLELFALNFFPHYCVHPLNQFHFDYIEECKFGERKVRRARAAPRGYAKSTFVALIKPIHDLCYGLEKFIIIASNSQTQANSKLKDIRNEILTNERLRFIYRVGFPRKNVGETEYIASSGRGKDSSRCFFKAIGSGVQVRGARFNEARPSKIICDDVEHSEEVLNEEIRRKYENWFFEDVCKLGDENTNIEFVGTVLHEDALLVHLLDNPGYLSKKYRAVISWSEREDLWQKWQSIYTNLDSDTRKADSTEFYRANEAEMLRGTQVLWPEKEPYLALMMERIEQGNRSFMKEKQNEPQGDSSKIFEHFHYYKEVDDGFLIEGSGAIIKKEELKLVYGVLDPATGKRTSGKPLGDYAVITLGYKDPRGRLLVHRDWTKREPPTKYIKQIFNWQQEYGLEKFGVEENLYRELLLPNITQERDRIQKETGKIVKIGFYEIDQSKNKIERITAIEPKVTHGWILFNRALSAEFMNQMKNFPGVHDDCPDTVEMLWNLVNNRYKVSSLSVSAMSGR